MSSRDYLQRIPAEIQFHIFSLLKCYHLADLALASKKLHSIVNPLLWADIDLHTREYHRYQYIRQGPTYRDLQGRPCFPWDGWGSWRAKAFFTMLQTLHVENPNHLERVAQRVKHLCTDVLAQWEPSITHGKAVSPNGIRVWELLPYFSNLESLELVGDAYDTFDQEDPVTEIIGPTPRLRFVKLSGYIPRSVPAWVLKAGDTLERLELGILDRPISSASVEQPGSIPLLHETTEESDYSKLLEDDYSDSEDCREDWASLCGDAVTPRPLGGYLTSYKENELKLPKLKHLHLCQPTWSDYNSIQYTWSSRADDACLRDWRRILETAMPTLSTLVLEQRPSLRDTEIGFSKFDEQDWIGENIVPQASHSLLEMVREVLENSRQGPLDRVYLRGICRLGFRINTPNEERPWDRLLALLESRGIKPQEEIGRWCTFGQDSGHAFWDYKPGEKWTIRGSTS